MWTHIRKRLMVCCALSILLSTSVTGCGVEMANHTPPTFPFKAQDILGQPFLYNPTPQAIIEKFDTPDNFFYLEVKPKLLTTIRNVSVIIDGEPHNMNKIAGSGRGGLYMYNDGCVCKEDFKYHYTVNYRAFWFLHGNRTIGPFNARSDGWLDVLWFMPGAQAHYGNVPEPAPVIRFDTSIPGQEEQIIIIKNLRDEKVELYGVSLVDAVGASNNDEFELIGVPPNASGPPLPPANRFYLDCGDYLKLSVRHNGPTEGAIGAFSMLASSENINIVFNKLVFLVETNLNPP